MVYTSTSPALASLEFFAHLDPTVAPDDLVITSATIPDGAAIGRIAMQELPDDWRATDNAITQRRGATWIARQASVALEVPSIVVEGDWNVLLNPAHPDFARIIVDEPKPWSFDERMFHPSTRKKAREG
jgi:RES domain-containing protein